MKERVVDEKLLEKVDPEKRDFLKKVIIGTAFAAPLIQSYSMDGFKAEIQKAHAY